MQAIIVIFSLNVKKFKSRYDINRFYHELYGWKQIVVKDSGKYKYQREGLLTNIPSIRPLETRKKQVGGSSFIIRKIDLPKILEYFEKLKNKVVYKFYEVKLNEGEKLL